MKAKVKRRLLRVSAKQKFEAYKEKAIAYIYALQHPARKSAFSVTAYSTIAGVKKPNTISVPELLAIVGTAGQLGKEVRVTVSGREDGGQVDFVYVDQPAKSPDELYY